MLAIKTRKWALRIAATVAALPLLQTGCTPDALLRSLANEVIQSGTQYTFEAADIIFRTGWGCSNNA